MDEDKDTYIQTLNTLIQTPENICRLISLSASKWTGSGISWTFSNDYSSYVSKERVFESIDEVIHNPIFATLSQDLKEIMAAFELWNKNEDVDVDERVTLVLVQELLDEWDGIARDIAMDITSTE